jgi:Reverse transcriptase (RNA-dependent DNA polymerase)
VLDDLCVWVKRWDNGDVVYILIYVDDLVWASSNKSLYDDFKSQIREQFEITEQGNLRAYLSVNYERREDGSMTADQSSMIDSILESHGMSDCKGISTPMLPGTTLRRACDEPLSEKDAKVYMSGVGKVNFLAVSSRPDISFCVSELAKAFAKPCRLHEIALKHLFRYLKYTRDYNICYGGEAAAAAYKKYGKNQLYAFADASFLSDSETYCGTTGFVVFLNGTAVMWKSRAQSLITRSTAEAEYVSASACVHEIIYLRRFLEALGFPQTGPTALLEDSTACIAICENTAHRERTKHINLHKYFARQHVADGTVRLVHCPTSEQRADLFTKALPKATVKEHTKVIMGHCSE